MEKLYVNETRANGEVSTVGLFYSRAEAESVIAQLRAIPEKQNCRYEITEVVARRANEQRSMNGKEC